jgi:riboflavin biosynthesis pyrimidine reductase
MVMSLDGSIVGADGVSKSISSPADRALFGQLRRAAEVILVGASTVRTENYRPARIPIAIVSSTLNLPAHLALFAEASTQTPSTMVLTSQVAIDAAPSELAGRIDLIACGAQKVDPRTAIDSLASRGLMRIHCEGGPTLLTALLEANALDELLLTVSPVFVGTAARLLSPSQFPGLTLQPKQVLTSDGSIFLRYLVTSK